MTPREIRWNVMRGEMAELFEPIVQTLK